MSLELVHDAGEWPSLEEITGWMQVAITAANGQLEHPVDGANVSALLTDDAGIQRLNTAFRGIEKPTNVLSFPSPSFGASAPVVTDDHLGDLAFGLQTIVRETELAGLSLHAHMTHLTVHGFLHLVGYDHEIDADAVVMESLETDILASLGLSDPYDATAQP